ncbi:c-type cytochrome [Deminuibacter soli]|uniref:Cytochrome C n=1 Tax=Deminuibacter soli TaxID=2291815 RepID=A0A3E1NJX8_9BACT|nr:c-type cytochrome [Deminuibacter soli]RFM28181.1 cytochrome C [Deminuibacter soli]
MKKVALVFLGIIVLLTAGIAYVAFALPDVGKAPNLTVDVTPEKIKRGEYLANHVAVCMDCHSTRNWQAFAGPPVPGTLGKGGEHFSKDMGFPGDFYAPNITPAALKDWTDGELFRAITCGVNKNGKAMFPLMPYPAYGKMDKEDVYDIIAYLRSIPAIDNRVPASSPAFPVSFLLNTMPVKQTPAQRPAITNTLAYGAYLVNMAGCIECHTPDKRGQIIKEKAFNGGRIFKMPGGILRSPNLTPDTATGIGTWTAAAFVQRFKAYAGANAIQPVQQHSMNTPMPWLMYADMTHDDLTAIYTYLHSLPPVHNAVNRFTANQP